MRIILKQGDDPCTLFCVYLLHVYKDDNVFAPWANHENNRNTLYISNSEYREDSPVSLDQPAALRHTSNQDARTQRQIRSAG